MLFHGGQLAPVYASGMNKLPLLTALAALVPCTPLTAQSRPAVLDTIVLSSRVRTADPARVVSVISRDANARPPPRNVAELLAVQMGVDVYGRSAAQADISLRGSTADQTLVLVDGIRMSDVQTSHYALDLAVPLCSFERHETLHGSPPPSSRSPLVLYGRPPTWAWGSPQILPRSLRWSPESCSATSNARESLCLTPHGVTLCNSDHWFVQIWSEVV